MNLARAAASGFGAGYAPRAPGTAGSVVGLFFGAILLMAGHLPLVLGALIAGGVGIWAIRAVGGVTDPGWIVIDEIAGQMVAMLALTHVSLLGLLIAFCLFRFFDITKIGPVGWADRRHDEWGVMGDDVIAGVFAGFYILLLRLVLPL